MKNKNLIAKKSQRELKSSAPFFTAQPQDHSKVAVKTEPKSGSIIVKQGSLDVKSKDLDMQSFIIKMSRKMATLQSCYGVPSCNRSLEEDSI